MSAPFLELRDVVVVRGGQTILDVPQLALADAVVLAALGRNGAGKSTLLRIVGGLGEPTRGTILLDGNPSTPGDRRRMISAVMQRPLLRRGTVYSNVEAGMRFQGTERAERAAQTKSWLDRLQLSHLADRDVHTLSGGEAQRVSLARALALRPRLLLLDEAFTTLDTPTKAELLGDVRALIDEAGCAALFVTHDRHEASLLADRVAIVHQGRILQEGPLAQVYDQPADVTTAELVGYVNQLPADRLPSSIPRRGSTLLIRASDVSVGSEPANGWQILAVATRATIDGDVPSVAVMVGTIQLIARLGDVVPPAPGESVTLQLDPRRVRWC